MTISLQCSCGKQLQVEESQAGGQLTCPDCNTTLAVPPADDGVSLDDLSLDDLNLDDLDDLDDDDDYELDIEPPPSAATLDIGLDALTDLADTPLAAAETAEKPAAKAGAKQTPPDPSADKCPGCGADLAAGAVLCVGCGLDLRTGEKHTGLPPSAAAAPPSAAPQAGAAAIFQQYRIPILASIGGLVAVGGIVAFLLSGDGATSNKADVAKNSSASDYADDEPEPEAEEIDPDSDSPIDPKQSEPADSTNATDAAATNAQKPSDDPSQPNLVASLDGHTSDVVRIEFSTDAQRALSIDSRGTAILWNLADNSLLQKLTVGTRGRATFLPSGNQVLVHEGRNQLKVVDVATGQPAQTIEGAVGGELALAIDSDGKTALLSGTKDSLVAVNLATARVTVAAVQFPRETRFVRFSPDGRSAIVADASSTLSVWDVPLQQQVRTLDGHVTEIHDLAISADSKQALSAAGGNEYIGDARSRTLAHHKITDLALRLWDLRTGEELRRYPIASLEPARAVAFVGAQNALWLGQDVHVIDLESGATLASIAMDSASATPANSRVARPDPALAASGDGRQVLIAGADYSLRLWRLPDLTKLKSELPSPKPPAELPPLANVTAAQSSPAAVEMDEATKAVWHAVANHHPALKDLWKQLNAQPRTPENLMTIAQWCAKEKLYLEAEECLRAVLAVAPETPKAASAYEKLATLSTAPSRSVVPATSIATAPKVKITDDIQDLAAPEGKSLVVLPLGFDASAASVRIDDKTLTAKSDGGPAEFLGIVRKPTSEVKGLARNEPQPSGKTQLWETVVVTARPTGETLVRLQNRQRPARESRSRNRPANASDPIALRSDRTYFDEPYDGPYEAVFAVPAGGALLEVQYESEPPVGLLQEEPESIAAALAAADAAPQHLATIMQLAAANPGPETSGQLDQILARGDDATFNAAREAQRQVRRQRNLLAPVFHPTDSSGHNYLESLVIDSDAVVSDPRRPAGAAAGPQPVKIAATFKLAAPGKYVARVFAFGVAARYQLQAQATVQFEAKEPGLAYWSHVVAGAAAAPNRVVELWRDGILLERSIIALDETAAAAIAARVPVIKPAAATGVAPAVRPPVRRLPTRLPNNAAVETPEPDLAEIIHSESIAPVTAVMLADAGEQDLPLAYRIARYYLTKEITGAEPPRILGVLAEVGRLEAANPATRQQASHAIESLLGGSSSGLLARLLAEGPDSIRVGTIEALTELAPTSPDACRALLREKDRDTAPVIDKLVADGVLENSNGDWLFNGELLQSDGPPAAADGETEPEETADDPASQP